MVVHPKGEVEVEAGGGGDAFGVAGMLGSALDAVDHVFHLGFGQQQVFAVHLFRPIRFQSAVPKGQTARTDLAQQIGRKHAIRRATE